MKKKLMALFMAVAVATTIVPCKAEAADTKTVYLLDSYTFERPEYDTEGTGKYTYTKNGFIESHSYNGHEGPASSYDEYKYTYDKSNRIITRYSDGRLGTPSTEKLSYKGTVCTVKHEQKDWDGTPNNSSFKYYLDKKGRVTKVESDGTVSDRNFKYNSKGFIEEQWDQKISYDKQGNVTKVDAYQDRTYKLKYKNGRLISATEYWENSNSGTYKFKYKKCTVNKKDAARILKQQKAELNRIYCGMDLLNRPDILY